jgi:hypothetical protein
VNIHSPALTKAFANNTNVLVAMNGPVVFYVTGYQAKSQQKEEQAAYSKVSAVLCKLMDRQDEENTSDVTPHQQGFRRLLAGIYTHTNAHIIAAPMAHFLALNESRFWFSHKNIYLPVIAIESYLQNADTTGTFRMVGGKPTWYHRGMDYIYRPKEMEKLSLLDFSERTKSITYAQAKSEGRETFQFTKDHPFQKSYCVMNRDQQCIASFPWTWLQSTAKWTQSSRTNISTSHKDFKIREEYCRRFMMLFMPFRSMDDFLENTDNYHSAFATYDANNADTCFVFLCEYSEIARPYRYRWNW